MPSDPHVSEGVKDGSKKLTFRPLHHWEIGVVQNRSGQSDGEMNITVSVETTNKMQPCNRIYYSTVH